METSNMQTHTYLQETIQRIPRLSRDYNRWSGFRAMPIHVVANREFASPKLAEWLKSTYAVDATLRMKASRYLNGDGMTEIKIATLLQKIAKGSRRVLYDRIVTRDSTFKMNVVLNWSRNTMKRWLWRRQPLNLSERIYSTGYYGCQNDIKSR